MKRYVHFPKVEGQASRQAHADLPAGTYEREISKEGFFGPASHLYHRHPPTGWVNFEGPLRPHAFDCTKLPAASIRPGAPRSCCTTPRCACASGIWTATCRSSRAMPTATSSCSCMPDAANCSATTAICRSRPATTSSSRAARCGASSARSRCVRCSSKPLTTHIGCPDKGLVGPHAIFDAAMLDTPRIDEAFKDQQDDTEWQRRHQAARRGVHRHLSVQSTRCRGLARRSLAWCASTCATCVRS